MSIRETYEEQIKDITDNLIKKLEDMKYLHDLYVTAEYTVDDYEIDSVLLDLTDKGYINRRDTNKMYDKVIDLTNEEFMSKIKGLNIKIIANKPAGYFYIEPALSNYALKVYNACYEECSLEEPSLTKLMEGIQLSKYVTVENGAFKAVAHESFLKAFNKTAIDVDGFLIVKDLENRIAAIDTVIDACKDVAKAVDIWFELNHYKTITRKIYRMLEEDE